MSSDQQADLFRGLKEADRGRLFHVLDAADPRGARAAAGLPADQRRRHHDHGVRGRRRRLDRGARARRHIREVARAKETVYAIYVVNPRTQRLRPRRVAPRAHGRRRAPRVLAVGSGARRSPSGRWTDREDVAGLISKYNLLAVPVVDEAGRILGIVTVDDVIDAMVAEQTEDAQRFGGMDALDKPYLQIGFGNMVRSAPAGSAPSSSARCSPRPPCSTSSASSAGRSCSPSSSR